MGGERNHQGSFLTIQTSQHSVPQPSVLGHLIFSRVPKSNNLDKITTSSYVDSTLLSKPLKPILQQQSCNHPISPNNVTQVAHPNRIQTHLLCFRLFTISRWLGWWCSTPTIPEIGSVQMTQFMSHITLFWHTEKSGENRSKVTCQKTAADAEWKHRMLPILWLQIYTASIYH